MPSAATGSRKARDTTPAYRRIQSEIQERIEKGELKMGDTVESERTLAKAHGVSLMTARQALVGLEREGLVERRRGAGTFVAPPKIHFNKLMSFTEQLRGRSLAPTSTVLSLNLIEDEPEIAGRLSLPLNAHLIKLERLRLASGEPFAVETCYLAADAFPSLSRAALERGSLFSLLEREYGVEMSYADEDVDATVADSHLARILAVSTGHPLLRIRQTIFSARGTPTVCVLGLYRADRHVLRIRRFR